MASNSSCMCCNVLQRCSMLQTTYTHTHCNTLQHTATHCNTLQHTGSFYNPQQRIEILDANTYTHTLQNRSRASNENTYTYTNQQNAADCNELQRTSKHCNNTLQHAATHGLFDTNTCTLVYSPSFSYMHISKCIHTNMHVD